jgi:hypothetical protein
MTHLYGRRQVLITTLVLLLLTCTLLAAGCLKESVLQVKDVHVAADRVGPATAVFNVTSTVENTYGFPQGPATVILRVYDVQTSLLVEEQTSTIGTIGRSGTTTVSQQVLLPKKGSYRLEVSVLEKDIWKTSGSLTISGLERLPADSERNGIEIRDMDFMVKDVSDGRALIDVEIYFTNAGNQPSLPYDVEIRAREKDARLTADRQWVTVAEIPPESTVIRGVTITVPDQYNYEVDVLIWSNGTIVKEGQGLVQLRPGIAIPAGTQFTTRSIDTSAFVSKTQPAIQPLSAAGYPVPTRTPGFMAPAALIAALAGGILILSRRNQK